MARVANNTTFLEQWLRKVSGSGAAGSLVNENSPSARAIIQAWSELRDLLRDEKFDSRHLQALRTLVNSDATIHIADPQAKLLSSILASRNVSLPSEAYSLILRLLYVWIRKSSRPSLAVTASVVQVLCGVLDDERKLSPSLIAQAILLAGAFTCAPSLSENSKFSCLELLYGLLKQKHRLVGSREELVPEVLSGIGYAISASLDAHNVRLLDFLFEIWDNKEGPCGSVAHGLMILHLIEWVMSGFIRSHFGEKIILFVQEVLEASKLNYAAFAVLMAAAGVLRASTRRYSGTQNVDIVSRLRNAAENRINVVAQLLLPHGKSLFHDTGRDPVEALLLECFAIALARSGPISSSAPVLLCLVSALLTQVFPLGQIYQSVHNGFNEIKRGTRVIRASEQLPDVLFKESGAITGVFCNQYVSASDENKSIVENIVWDFCQHLYLQHRQVTLLLRGIEDKLLADIEKIAESSFLMVVVFALAVTKQLLNPIVPEERKMEISVKILVSFSCVEYFRRVRLPEYMDTIRGVVVRVQENDAACVSFVESMPTYDSLTNPKDLFMQSIKYAWSMDDVQTARILFYLRVIPTCIGRLPTSVFRNVAVPTMFLYMGHPNKKLARASHSLFAAFLSSGKESKEDERIQLKEHLVFYYMQRSLEGYPGITPFEGMASGVIALVRNLPAGSPAIYYSVNSLIEKASKLCSEIQNSNIDWRNNGQGETPEPCKQILELLLQLVSMVDIQVLPSLMKSLAQLIMKLPKEGQNVVLDELYGQVAESDDVIRKPALVSWLQSLNYICSQAANKNLQSEINTRQEYPASGGSVDALSHLNARL